MAFNTFRERLTQLFGRVKIESIKSDGTKPEYQLLELKAGGVTKCAIGSNGSLKLNKTGTDEPLYLINITTPDAGATGWRVNQWGGTEFGIYGALTGGGFKVTAASGLIELAYTGTRAYSRADGVWSFRGQSTGVSLEYYAAYTSNTSYQRMALTHAKQTLSAVSGATVSTTGGLIPAGAFLIGVTTRVNTALGTSNGTTGYSVGNGTDPNLWGDVTAVAAGTASKASAIASQSSGYTASDACGLYLAAQDVTLTATGGNFDATGAIEISAFYFLAEAD